jgi:hypothetical protein
MIKALNNPFVKLTAPGFPFASVPDCDWWLEVRE